MNLTAVLEGLLFLRGDEGLLLSEIKSILELDDDNKLKDLIMNLQEEYLKENRGIKIEKFGDYLKLATKKEHKEYYQKLIDIDESKGLSQSALETLAIIAYNSPVTRVKVDEIRGVSSSHIIRKLVARNLIKEEGRSELPGRPILYGTTANFLDYFGLNSIEDLPKLAKIEVNVVEDTNLFEANYKED